MAAIAKVVRWLEATQAALGEQHDNATSANVQRTSSDPVSIDRAMQSVTSNSPLPPSVEAAYYRKCIELKRRINEIEDSNDVIRTRKARVERSIMKLRLERAFLLEQIAKRMEHNVDDSDQSESRPHTVRNTASTRLRNSC